MILKILNKHVKNAGAICEFGGGGSCFYEAFRAHFPRAKYIVFDKSQNGVEAFNKSYQNAAPFCQRAFCVDLLDSSAKIAPEFDIVFSVGLIEHFDKKHTAMMITRHFEATKCGGIVLITYPTPTLIYRIIRGIAERLGVWEFPDERPLYFDEVNEVCSQFGALKAQKLNVYIGLCQEIVCYEKL